MIFPRTLYNKKVHSRLKSRALLYIIVHISSAVMRILVNARYLATHGRNLLIQVI